MKYCETWMHQNENGRSFFVTRARTIEAVCTVGVLSGGDVFGGLYAIEIGVDVVSHRYLGGGLDNSGD